MSERIAEVKRDTKETQVEVRLNLDGVGKSSISTPNGMFNHLLEQLSRHSLIDIEISATGDISPGWHHMVEDVGIVLGQALRQAIGEGKGIVRMAHTVVPLDETLVMVALDLGGRPYTVIKTEFSDHLVGDLPSDLIRHFLEVLGLESRINIHAEILTGSNDHHKAEALFKSLARAMRQALVIDPRV
ncbi:MAG: imidazoleglycerol-phosphate dehydratase HisB, partial [Anaerolineales bacterium]|nr:imidazoleglycerol-phosphate dehydratase HisB [Anaerolineales bacterium]